MRDTTRTREHGQILLMAALLLIPGAALAGLAIDLGYAYLSARDAQNAADAAVLSAAIELMDASATNADATDAARSAARQNGVDVQDFDCCAFQDTDGDGHSDRITAAVHMRPRLLLLGIVGITPPAVRREATAAVVHAASGPLCPWGLVARGPETGEPGTYWGLETGKVYLLKVDNGLQETGNFHGLRVGAGGVSAYRSVIESGCQPDDFGVYSEGDAVYIDTQPGNLGQATREALDTLFSYEKTDGIQDGQGFGYCDVAFTPDPFDPALGAPDAGEQWEPPRTGCGADAAGVGRIVIVPVIDSLPTGSSDPAHIVGLAAAYVAGWDRSGPPSDTRVYAIFMEQAYFDPRYLSGESDNPLAPLRPVLLR